MSLMNREDTLLVIIDCQTKLMPAIKDNDEIEETVVKLTKGAKVLDLPVIVTQQYTKGLGPTVDSLNEILGEYEPVEKTSFSACGAPEFVEAIKAAGKKNILMTGVETHICVEQTTLDLLEAGYNVYLIEDCVGSRKKHDKKIACQRMAAAGAVVTTYEAALYEILRGAKEEGFKAISAIIK
ncbi:MAG: hydrolase [Firmicutes bacterium]|nr:hydrolase [Bacillota bacterium]